MGGCLPRGVYTSPSRAQTDACENITFPQLLLRTEKIAGDFFFRFFDFQEVQFLLLASRFAG